jgi:hypothetical protein
MLVSIGSNGGSLTCSICRISQPASSDARKTATFEGGGDGRWGRFGLVTNFSIICDLIGTT